MREQCEFRVDAEFADLLFRPDEGEIIGAGLVKKVSLETGDPRFEEVGRLQRAIRAQDCGRALFFGWSYYRQYSREEIEAAEVFNLVISARFEPPGEACGTIYDDSTACPTCGGGGKQCSDLTLNVRAIPKTRDLASTIANEWIVSERLASLFQRERITGVELRPVRHYLGDETGLRKWYQIVIVSPPVALSPRTRLGLDPFDEDIDGAYRCPIAGAGHVAGLAILSEVHVNRSTWIAHDVVATQELVGTRRGLLRPYPTLLISRRLRKLLLTERVKKFDLEIAHFA